MDADEKNWFFGFVVLVFASLLGSVLYANYDAYWSPKAQKGYLNRNNIKRIAPDMTVAEVVTIMGQPVRVDSIKTFPGRTHFAYQMPPGSSWYCDVNFDSSGKVTSIYCTP